MNNPAPVIEPKPMPAPATPRPMPHPSTVPKPTPAPARPVRHPHPFRRKNPNPGHRPTPEKAEFMAATTAEELVKQALSKALQEGCGSCPSDVEIIDSPAERREVQIGEEILDEIGGDPQFQRVADLARELIEMHSGGESDQEQVLHQA
jgi:hypothetical protein